MGYWSRRRFWAPIDLSAFTHMSEEINSSSLPEAMQRIHNTALRAIGELVPAGAPKSEAEPKGLFLSSRTNGGRDLPPYYLVYFLLVDLLKFPNMGKWEKSAWTIPVRYQGRLYGIEHRKMGLGIFAPNLDPDARMSTTPGEEAEADAKEISALIKKGVAAAEPYFEWRAEQVVDGGDLNVANHSNSLFDRYIFFNGRFNTLSIEAELRKEERSVEKKTLENGVEVSSISIPYYALNKEAKWNAQAAIEAFFSWTEHVFIHLAILQGRLRSGKDVADIAAADWKTKFKAALDVSDVETQKHYDKLLGLRAQIRNFMAHGAFGKRGEAFSFHSGVGAVPVLLTRRRQNRYSFTGDLAFDESSALSDIEKFISHLWSGARTPAKHYLDSDLPIILTCVIDGTYTQAMQSDEEMSAIVDHLTGQFDRAGDMDW